MTLFDGFYQLGFVARGLDAAMAALGRRFGVSRFRQRQTNETMRTAHCYAGDVMIEMIAVTAGGPALYLDHQPEREDAIRLHHHGFLVRDVARWEEVVAAIDGRGLPTPLRGSVMDGHLRYLYADTRNDIGIYSEYVCLTGPALAIYDDVPRN
jgi:hypothetical protein